MLGLSGLSRLHRLIAGIVILILVDLIWVASSELTEYLFEQTGYRKPFFTTYVKTVMFAAYLFGFLIWKPWREQCFWNRTVKITDSALDSPEASDNLLSDPIFVPLKHDDKLSTSGTESDDAAAKEKPARNVRFSNLSEVRQLSDRYAEEHLLARLSYAASIRAEEQKLHALGKLSVRQVLKMAFLFCMLWFFANYSYQEALRNTQAGVVNVLSSTSGLFTLVCSAVCPSGPSDKFTLSKLVSVLLSIGGIAVVSVSDISMEKGVPAGALWAVVGALCYALYLVSLRRKVDHEDKFDIPMFFGFVGMFCALVLWPGFLILHYTKCEVFEWPNGQQWLLIAVNGLVGTIFSEFLWLWGCFLTSSLIATLSLSLTIPMTMMADVLMKGVGYSWLFYLGSVPVFISFFAISFLTHYENWDPVLLGVKKILHVVFRRRTMKPRIRELDREQTESLIISESNQ
ncbi:solute carrier family 35 member F5-like [Gigantopelta aegis]|uniref:solute carrier family 35 member F5-like n=1 Tax=Gigantopelta aegis TaxID=1735272 RepID=UPI001B88B9FB|nr:solute carrier family 35 member F5-like [Gigantopelta aegis]